MQPGLFRLGQDFGNGPDDARYFLRDSHAPSYRAAKLAVLETDPDRALLDIADPSLLSVHRSVSAWMRATLQREHGVLLPARDLSAPERVRDFYRELALELQEDFVVLHRGAGGERAALVSVCLPGAWRPERIVGQSFASLHAPVPEFERIAASATTLISAMIERGPYVRFVWNVVADAHLDHHPDRSPRASWSAETAGFLRVERQVSVPFAADQASLFLIRTYLYPLTELSAAQRRILRSALEQMPEPVQRYKGIAQALPLILAQLA
jgi:hypothetical protein